MTPAELFEEFRKLSFEEQCEFDRLRYTEYWEWVAYKDGEQTRKRILGDPFSVQPTSTPLSWNCLCYLTDEQIRDIQRNVANTSDNFKIKL